LTASTIVLLPGIAPKGARIFGCALVAINISLRWSESESDCCTYKLNSPCLFSAQAPFDVLTFCIAPFGDS
jgi:hypothetical protein